ncbi:hypothetical protein BV25DRAFT_1823829 [Artomyces pyxidatus]|uniref:Uncharacterized protein n=1 Tax=Artomyces pyxidatus TaxID=48021 RepID=A0ACB8T6N9_9AGAM|nr:hypothetical protein BV25DRAFT_1823829 [Artomyces pyxidatus]
MSGLLDRVVIDLRWILASLVGMRCDDHVVTPGQRQTDALFALFKTVACYRHVACTPTHLCITTLLVSTILFLMNFTVPRRTPDAHNEEKVVHSVTGRLISEVEYLESDSTSSLSHTSTTAAVPLELSALSTLPRQPPNTAPYPHHPRQCSSRPSIADALSPPGHLQGWAPPHSVSQTSTGLESATTGSWIVA